MKHKLIIALLASSSLLFSSPIVGMWTIDKNKAEKLFEAHAGEEMDQFVIALMVEVMTDIEFRKDGSCQFTTKNMSKCWKKSSDSSYILYEKDGSDKGIRAKMINAKNIEIFFAEQEFKFAFTRTNKEN